jgi:uncharacterized protein (TIGR02145 family)
MIMKKLLLICSVFFLMNSCKKADEKTTKADEKTTSVTDIDGNVYNTVTIGTQIWMAWNLKTTKYNDGTAIPNVTDNTTWRALTTGAYCDYDNNPVNSTTYGRLYNWYVVDNNAATKVTSNGGKNICPTGWHMPSDAEWTTLTTFLGDSVAAGKLKETGTTHWASSNIGSTNETGFNALPGGYRNSNGTYHYIVECVLWWSSTMSSPDDGPAAYQSPWYRDMFAYYTFVHRDRGLERSGLSVRCIKDN